MPTWGHAMSGAPELGPTKARPPSFPFQFKPSGTQYLSMTGGPGVYIAFFGYWTYGRTESYSMCSLILCAKTCTEKLEYHLFAGTLIIVLEEKAFGPSAARYRWPTDSEDKDYLDASIE